MSLHLHDTMSGQLQEVVPLESGHVRIYTCGPTVYDRAHIGNFRTYVYEDVLRCWLEHRFERVTHVMNLTDVEDKIIRNAMAHKVSLDQETAPHIKGFFEDLDALGIRRAHHYPRATEYIEQMVGLIEQLNKRGMTYEVEGSVYFRIASFPDYGKLSGTRPQNLLAGAGGRVDADEYEKEDVRDFALWKAVVGDEPGWETSLGLGRPGWHIECSAMSMALLGENFDIHCGGVDNIFPHHENEIAQSEAATGKRFVSIWCHAAHLQISGDKMAKSAGNFSALRQLLDSDVATPAAIRYFLCAIAHYRKPLNYTDDALYMGTEAVERLVTFRDRVVQVEPAEATDNHDKIQSLVDQAWKDFSSAMDNDLNLPQAMGTVFASIRELNRILDASSVSLRSKQAIEKYLAQVDNILGVLVLVDVERAQNRVSSEAQILLDLRTEARRAKNWAKADEIRQQLADMGIVVEDAAAGQRLRKN